MSLLALDLGGTKLAVGLFDKNGKLLFSKEDPLAGKEGKEVGDLPWFTVRSTFGSTAPSRFR